MFFSIFPYFVPLDFLNILFNCHVTPDYDLFVCLFLLDFSDLQGTKELTCLD